MAGSRRTLGYVSSWNTVGTPIDAPYGVATGGTSASRTIGGVNYTVLTFTSDSNLVVSKAGLFDVLLVGGGGGGAGVNQSASNTNAGGGGGAGALIGLAETTTIYLAAGTYAVDVGAGGAAGMVSGGLGLASSIGSLISAAGGGRAGGSFSSGGYDNAGAGGSGGGNTGTNADVRSVTPLYGKSGGTGTQTAGGGGGGYSSAGGNGVSTTGGSGGNGVDVSSWGTSASTDNIAAGGGGGGSPAGAAGTGGVAGVTGNPANAATTAGSGGGGSRGSDGIGGAGANGKVWVRFKV